VSGSIGRNDGVSRPSADRDVRRIATDPDGFEAFYRAHVEVVARFVARRVGDPHLAADLIADVFVAAIDSASTYPPERGDPTAGSTAWRATSWRPNVAGARPSSG
jgi:hypothetical protein